MEIFVVLRTPMFNEHLEQLEKQINRYRALLSGYKKLYFFNLKKNIVVLPLN